MREMKPRTTADSDDPKLNKWIELAKRFNEHFAKNDVAPSRVRTADALYQRWKSGPPMGPDGDTGNPRHNHPHVWRKICIWKEWVAIKGELSTSQPGMSGGYQPTSQGASRVQLVAEDREGIKRANARATAQASRKRQTPAPAASSSAPGASSSSSSSAASAAASAAAAAPFTVGTYAVQGQQREEARQASEYEHLELDKGRKQGAPHAQRNQLPPAKRFAAMLSALDTAAPDTQAAVAAWFAQDMSKVNLALTSAFAAAKLLYEEGSEELKAELTGLREAYKKDKLVLEAERDLRLKAISEASAAATSTSKRVKKSATPPSSACEQSGSGSEVQVVDDEEGAGGK